MLYVFAGDILPGKLHAYVDWVHQNESALEKAAPQGFRLRGIFLTVQGFGKHDTEIHWEVETYGAFDNAYQKAIQGSDYATLLAQWNEFLVPHCSEGRLLRQVGHDSCRMPPALLAK